MKVLIKDAVILTMDPKNTIIEKGAIEIIDDKISWVGKEPVHDESYFNEIIDAKGKLITPGLYNSHTHSPLSIAKGAMDKAFHAVIMWYIQGWTANRSRDEIYASTRYATLEMLKTGTVGCIDHFPEQYFEAEDVDAAAQAYIDSKMKATLALRIYDLEYSDILPVDRNRLSPDLKIRLQNSPLKVRPVAETVAICRRSIEKWHGFGEKLQIALGPSAPLRCSEELLRQVKLLSEEYGVGVHTHLLESKVQTEISQKLYGKTLVQLLADLGLLNETLSCAHTIWVTDEDIRLLGDNGVSVVHNIASNLKGSNGISPIRRLQEAGCNISLGTDGCESNGSLNLFSQTKIAIVAHRINEPDMSKWLSSEEIMRMMTVGGAKASMNDASGSLEAGRKADVVMYDLNSPWLTPCNNPLDQLIYSENGSSVDTVVIDGEIVVENGRVLTMNEELVKMEARELAGQMMERNKEIFKTARELIPILQEEHLLRFRNK